MRMSEAARKIDSANLGESNHFTIAQNAHAFRILSDGLYSDKITAILRELSTNAVDSHKMAGSTEPFEIKLPSYIDPTFYVRDFGVGLSHENVMHLFSTYFQSDKSHNNDLTGGFGLGSKSPFSYTDSFSVASCYNDTKTTYNAYIAENGCPEIVAMCSEKTSNRNGVEISFPVKREDFNEFARKLASVVSYLDIKPKVIGNDFYPVEINYTHKGDTWGLRCSDGCYHNSYARIIMGGVAYPVDPDHFDRDKYGSLIMSPLDLFLNIGEVAINPSREALNYRKPDIDKLCRIFDKTILEISKIFGAEVMAQPTIWDAVVSIENMYAKTPALRQILTMAKFLIDKEEIRYNWYPEKTVPENFTLDTYRVSNWGKKDHSFCNSQKTFGVRPAAKTVIILDDMVRGGLAKFNYYRKENNEGREIIFVKQNKNQLEADGTPKKVLTGVTLAEVTKFFCGAPVLTTSGLPDVPRKERADKSDKKQYAYMEVCNTSSGYTHNGHSSMVKSDILDKLNAYVEDGVNLVFVRQQNNITETHATCIENDKHPTREIKDVWSPFTTMRMINQLRGVLTVPDTVFIFVKNDGIIHKYIKENFDDVENFEDWLPGTLFPIIADDVKTNGGNFFKGLKEREDARRLGRVDSIAHKFVTTYGSLIDSKSLNVNNALLDTMYGLISEVSTSLTLLENNSCEFHRLESAINYLIKNKIVDYNHDSSVDKFVKLVPMLMKFPMIANCFGLSDKGYSSSPFQVDSRFLSDNVFMKNCVDYMNFLSQKN